MRTYVIAEAGSCHDGDLGKAVAMVQLAADCGANAVKFQWLSSAERLVERRRAEGYLDAYKLIEFPLGWHDELAKFAGNQHLDYLCTGYLPKDIPVLDRYVAKFKIASFEAAALDILEAHRPFIYNHRKDLIVSTGMGDEKLCLGLRVFQRQTRSVMALLHCVSAYPAPIEAANLCYIRRFDLDGFSDHTASAAMGGLAVMAGARIVEVHFRLGTTDPKNRDYPHALPPAKLRKYIDFIRTAEKAYGDPTRPDYLKTPHSSEAPMMKYRVRQPNPKVVQSEQWGPES